MGLIVILLTLISLCVCVARKNFESLSGVHICHTCVTLVTFRCNGIVIPWVLSDDIPNNCGCMDVTHRCVGVRIFSLTIVYGWLRWLMLISWLILHIFLSSYLSKHAGFELIMCMNGVFQVLVNVIVSALRYGWRKCLSLNYIS